MPVRLSENLYNFYNGILSLRLLYHKSSRCKPTRRYAVFCRQTKDLMVKCSQTCGAPQAVLLHGKIRSRRICPTLESAHRQTTDKTKSPVFLPGFLLYLMPGSSLLSHGETPHYHRRYGVSLLSSAWGQVGPPR